MLLNTASLSLDSYLSCLMSATSLMLVSVFSVPWPPTIVSPWPPPLRATRPEMIVDPMTTETWRLLPLLKPSIFITGSNTLRPISGLASVQTHPASKTLDWASCDWPPWRHGVIPTERESRPSQKGPVVTYWPTSWMTVAPGLSHPTRAGRHISYLRRGISQASGTGFARFPKTIRARPDLIQTSSSHLLALSSLSNLTISQLLPP